MFCLARLIVMLEFLLGLLVFYACFLNLLPDFTLDFALEGAKACLILIFSDAATSLGRSLLDFD